MRIKFYVTYNIGETKVAEVNIACDEWEGDIVRKARCIVEQGVYLPSEDTVISPSCIKKVSWDCKRARALNRKKK